MCPPDRVTAEAYGRPAIFSHFSYSWWYLWHFCILLFQRVCSAGLITSVCWSGIFPCLVFLNLLLSAFFLRAGGFPVPVSQPPKARWEKLPRYHPCLVRLAPLQPILGSKVCNFVHIVQSLHLERITLKYSACTEPQIIFFSRHSLSDTAD